MICEKIRLDPRVLFFIVTVVKNTLQCLMRTQQEARNSTRKKKIRKGILLKERLDRYSEYFNTKKLTARNEIFIP